MNRRGFIKSLLVCGASAYVPIAVGNSQGLPDDSPLRKLCRKIEGYDEILASLAKKIREDFDREVFEYMLDQARQS